MRNKILGDPEETEEIQRIQGKNYWVKTLKKEILDEAEFIKVLNNRKSRAQSHGSNAASDVQALLDVLVP